MHKATNFCWGKDSPLVQKSQEQALQDTVGVTAGNNDNNDNDDDDDDDDENL